MLDRLNVTLLLKSIIAAMAACVIFAFGLLAWQSWKSVEATRQISTIADASANAFKAMHNLRTDRSSSTRSLNADETIDQDATKYIRGIRDTQMPAVQKAADLAAELSFAEKDVLLPELNRLIKALTSLQTEFWAAVAQPKASRRAGMSKEYTDVSSDMLKVLDKMSGQLLLVVNHADPVVDQLFAIKQSAWLLRNVAGEASVLVSGGLAAGKLKPDDRLNYTKFVGGIDAAWSALEGVAVGTQLPPELSSAIAAAKTTYFDPQYNALRDKLFNALATGDKPEMNATQWSPYTVERMASAVTVAERALDAARDRGVQVHSAAMRSLITQLVLLVAAFGLAFVSMMLLSRRVINPLHAIRDAMLKVAGGDLDTAIPYSERRDEIGALAGALSTFKTNAIEKERIESDQREHGERGALRQRAVEAHITAFESQVREALDALTGASEQMSETSENMSAVAEQTTAQAQLAAKASGDASANVQSVAAASEELSASINDISRQVTHAATIAGQAVNQASQTDATVQGLAETAARIGDVVKLINDIAGQTNLLALNATIEAARAGEAGKGFAVVASEVKSLASQTAKATEDISQQIAAVQKVAHDAMDAIKGIGDTISKVSEVATAIAAAVEEQGAATLEITRNTQQAAQGTREVSDNMTGVTGGADATGASAQNVRLAANELGLQAQQLRGQVNEFLSNIRAA